MRYFATVAAILLAATIPAQHKIAFPQDTTATHSGSIVPLGVTGNGRSDEGRFQQMIPARLLPGRTTVLTGIDVFTMVGSGPVTYQSLKITLGLTRRTFLSKLFANNLNSSTLVLDRTNERVVYLASGWTHIQFDRPFFYDGRSNLVVEIEKVLDGASQLQQVMAHGNTYNPPRTDLPRSVYATGVRGSGARSAVTASHEFFPLCLRLTTPTSTVAVRSDPGGANRQTFAIGGQFELLNYGSPGDRYTNYISAGFTTGVPLLGGIAYLRQPFFLLGNGTIPASGLATTRYSIPPTPELIGVPFVAQAVAIERGTALLTNATDWIVNS